MQKSYSNNFKWTKYSKRGKYWTYSMVPKASVRILRPVALQGYNELGRKYGSLGPIGGSLADQYFCHFDLVFEHEWNIEKGRPNISYPGTITKLCNPK